MPKHLLSFVELHLDTYLNNAMQAVFLHPDANYVIDYDRSRHSEGSNFIVSNYADTITNFFIIIILFS